MKKIAYCVFVLVSMQFFINSSLFAAFFYEQLSFSKSAAETYSDDYYIYSFYQPKSEADIFGIKIGALF